MSLRTYTLLLWMLAVPCMAQSSGDKPALSAANNNSQESADRSFLEGTVDPASGEFVARQPLHIVAVRHAGAAQVEKVLAKLFPNVDAVVHNSDIYFRGDAATAEGIQQFIKQLDTPAAAETPSQTEKPTRAAPMLTEVYVIEGVDRARLTDIVQPYLRTSGSRAKFDGDKLIVMASADAMKDIKSIIGSIHQLSQSSSEVQAGFELAPTQRQNGPVGGGGSQKGSETPALDLIHGEIAALTREVDNLEHANGAEQERSELADKLRAAVRRQFDLRQRLQRAEASLIQKQLSIIHGRLQQREQLRDKIIERRVSQLLADPSIALASEQTRIAASVRQAAVPDNVASKRGTANGSLAQRLVQVEVELQQKRQALARIRPLVKKQMVTQTELQKAENELQSARNMNALLQAEFEAQGRTLETRYEAARRKTDIATEAWESVKFRFSVGNATQEAVAESRLRVEDLRAEIDQVKTQLDLWHEAHDLIQKNRPTKPADNETAADESVPAPATEDATSSEITAPVEEGSEDATVESSDSGIAEPAADEALKATEY